MLCIPALLFFIRETGDDAPGGTTAASSMPSRETASEEPVTFSINEISFESTDTEETTEEPEPPTVVITAVGDMLMHRGISDYALNRGGGTEYLYDYLFEHIRDRLDNADLAVINNEVIFGGNELGILGYPYFSVRTELGDAERRAGFNVILNASNHTNDQQVPGILNTLDYWSKYPEITSLGIHDSAESLQQVDVVEVNGIRIGMMNLTYGLNVDYIPQESSYLVEMMTQDRIPQIAEKLAWARENTDFVIVFPHWGGEYDLTHNDAQSAWAGFFAENGADLIIGSHSHTVQDSEWIATSDGRSVFCFYSLGNFVSLQAMTINMLGLMPQITLVKDDTGCRIANIEKNYIFTFFTQGSSEIAVFPLEEVTDELLQRHSIQTPSNEPFFNEMNSHYPLTLEVLKSLCK